jgi:hypothetical protein
MAGKVVNVVVGHWQRELLENENLLVFAPTKGQINTLSQPNVFARINSGSTLKDLPVLTTAHIHDVDHIFTQVDLSELGLTPNKLNGLKGDQTVGVVFVAVPPLEGPAAQ